MDSDEVIGVISPQGIKYCCFTLLCNAGTYSQHVFSMQFGANISYVVC